MTWGLFLRLAALKTAFWTIVVGVVLGDKEAIAIGVGLAIGLGLLSFRSGLLGRVVVLILSLDVMVWMAPAAVANVADGEDFFAVVVPLGLSVAAAIAACAAICDTLQRRGLAVGGRRAPLALGGASLIVFVVTLLLAQLDLFGSPVEARAGEIRMPMKDAKFKTENVEVSAAGPITFAVENDDLFWHTFTIDALDVDVRVPVQASRRVTFTAPPGTYEFYCAIPGHQAIGMEGTLTVLPD